MRRLFIETGIAALVYFALALGLRFGMDEGDGWAEALLSAGIFAVFYFIVGAGLIWYKGRKS